MKTQFGASLIIGNIARAVTPVGLVLIWSTKATSRSFLIRPADESVSGTHLNDKKNRK